MIENIESKFYKIGEVCQLMGISRMSLIRWEDENKINLKSIKTPGNHRRYRKDEVDTFLAVWGKE